MSFVLPSQTAINLPTQHPLTLMWGAKGFVREYGVEGPTLYEIGSDGITSNEIITRFDDESLTLRHSASAVS